MTKDDNLFDIKYVIFDADEGQSLIGKDVFVSDSLINLRDAVNRMDIDNPNYCGQLMSADNATATFARFKIHCDNRTFKYVYYDPYYELKCALKRGETIEHRLSSAYWCIVTCPSFDDKPEYYRIKQDKPEKPALKWQDLKIGDIIRGPLIRGFNSTNNDFYGVVTMIDVDSDTKAHVCLGNQWIEDANICKFRRVDMRGVDVE